MNALRFAAALLLCIPVSAQQSGSAPQTSQPQSAASSAAQNDEKNAAPQSPTSDQQAPSEQSGAPPSSNIGANGPPPTGGPPPGAVGRIFRVTGKIKAPKPIATPNPVYPPNLKRTRQEARVLVWLVVNDHGLPFNPKVVRSGGSDFDRNALEAVRQWRFKPATLDGRPVAVEVQVEVNFRP